MVENPLKKWPFCRRRRDFEAQGAILGYLSAAGEILEIYNLNVVEFRANWENCALNFLHPRSSKVVMFLPTGTQKRVLFPPAPHGVRNGGEIAFPPPIPPPPTHYVWP